MKIQVDGIHWVIENEEPHPICPKHHLELEFYNDGHEWETDILTCDEGHNFNLPRTVYDEKRYVLKRLRSKAYKEMKLINLDDVAIPLAEKKIKSKDSKYFITGLLTESKVGLRLVLYAGKIGSSKKTQIFVEPEIKRLAFDQNDLHPTDVFTKIEATFRDNKKASFSEESE